MESLLREIDLKGILAAFLGAGIWEMKFHRIPLLTPPAGCDTIPKI